MYQVTKTYGHERGLSCCFRQPKADSHCNLLHGYALAFTLVFQSETLNDKNWVIDFGGLKDIESFLKHAFDHTTVIASSDPHIDTFRELQRKGLIDLCVLHAVGCEAFAKYVHDSVSQMLLTMQVHAKLYSVTVAEHGANSATYIG